MLPSEPTETTPEPEAPEVEAEAAPEEGQETPPEAEGKEEAPPEEGAKEEEKPEETPPETPEAKHKRSGGFQRKIDRLERQNQQLMEMLQRSGVQPAQGAQGGKEKSPEEKAADFIDGLVEKKVAAREAQRHAQQAKSEFERRTQEVRAAHPDFDEALADVAHIPVHQAVNEALLTSERGAEIMYALATNPAELARLSALPPLAAVREVGRLEAKLASGATPQKPKVVVRPPVPPSKVGGTAAKSTRALEDLPISEYKRAMRSRGR